MECVKARQQTCFKGNHVPEKLKSKNHFITSHLPFPEYNSNLIIFLNWFFPSQLNSQAMNVSGGGKSCMLLECLIITSFVSTTLKFAESTVQTIGINTFTLSLLLALKADSVVFKTFLQK